MLDNPQLINLPFRSALAERSEKAIELALEAGFYHRSAKAERKEKALELTMPITHT